MKQLIYILGIILLFASCSKENDYYIRKTDLVPITEVYIPDSAEVDDTVQIEATAEVYSDCWKNLFFDFRQVGDTLYSLKALGTFESYGDCNSATITQDTVIDIIPDTLGTYLFYIRRDPYTVNVDTLHVREKI